MEASILDMEYQIIDMTERESKVPADEVRRIALAWSGKHEALNDLSKQSMRLGNYRNQRNRNRKIQQRNANPSGNETREKNPAPEPKSDTEGPRNGLEGSSNTAKAASHRNGCLKNGPRYIENGTRRRTCMTRTLEVCPLSRVNHSRVQDAKQA